VKETTRGAALAVALVLLTGLSALALAAAAAAVTALALVGHQQDAAIALEAAEAGIAGAIQRAREFAGPSVVGPLPHGAGGATEAHFETRTTELAADGALPPGFSIGAGGTRFRAQHFLIVSDGWAARNTRVRLEQGFYVVVSLE